ncbi:polysaccharide pyruvyl transferase family protein [Reichenbachiella agarivorans]|uniref:Polysaccharide pyruvyl transferase family protein n=1 Tax=Reichenbachiella agarivorans TaxID=2979464 RepID=A0ABY6CNY1_9BACT|nr:polysaccharide pyruvyl transferase family protein [Reichenbachiella agarivorans]UXP31063.1 polysaccharide pyruvyl transferase family protein [Reichenbachiella agarivorans]
MKKAVLLYKKSKNIGDDIQGLAALTLLNDPETVILDRENLSQPEETEDLKLLCNGWFMDYAENWPPAKNVHPYFISFHVAKYPKIRKLMLDPKLVPYYQQFEPIGCRDHETVTLFNNIGINTYFSGCLTLTLPKSEKKRSNDIIITDLFINDILTGDYAKKVSYKLIPEKYHKYVKLRTHVRPHGNVSVADRLKDSQALLDEYAQAKLVVTSRIHCALPCLALGTPVYFLDFGYVRKSNRDRFDGILDLMHVVRPTIPFHENTRLEKIVKFFGLHRLFFPFIKKLKIDWENPLQNPTEYQQIADKIKKRVSDEFGLN